MGAVRGAIVSSIGLVLLYDLSTTKSGGVDTLFGLPGRVADYIINPTKPLIPDLRASSKGNLKTGISGTVPDTSLGAQFPANPGQILDDLKNLPGALGAISGQFPFGGGLSGTLAPGFPAAPSSSSSSSGSGTIRSA